MTKQDILNSIRQYYQEQQNQKTEWKIGDPIRYAGRVYDENELVNLVDSALEFWLTSGRFCDEFTEKFSQYLGIKYCELVNSGSSANLLAFMTLCDKELGDRHIGKGDEVITVACGFPTTVAPIVQSGAVPVFVDVKIPYYNIDISKLENAMSDKTKAVFIAHTLGLPFDINVVKKFCEKHNLWLIEDNCDALGSKVGGKFTGTIGDIGTSSFYPAHHMTTGEGGAVYTNNSLLHKISLSLRDWGRDCVCPSGTDNVCGNRFNRQDGTLPFGYDHKYVYGRFGYNLKMTDPMAAIGVAQVDKLDDFTKKRQSNFKRLYNNLQNTELILPKIIENAEPSPFGFIITVTRGNRNALVKKLEENKVQTRNLFAGNLTRHPACDGVEYRVSGGLIDTDRVMNDSFWIGVYPGMTEDMLDFMSEIIIKYEKIN
ncbi:MAG: lipopolysaccharide biosynthesis protein RfbH [Oscillospiraceae bacterium]|jgi:CDP-6-deoxy-D-xylo-4-hexulose-3-dehydrase|nr:lipopolysaccharide biosynthesis protein RfbH [Oscillospiraceae bacterium]